MAQQKAKQVVISEEDAVFWMDKNGNWCNIHGKFEHPKIIRFFNASIRKDERGYYVYQATKTIEEKVYFNYEDTPLFVTDILIKDDILLKLNTYEIIQIQPECLISENDQLYMHTSDHKIKFTSHALVKLSEFIQDEDGRLMIKIKEKTYSIG